MNRRKASSRIASRLKNARVEGIAPTSVMGAKMGRLATSQ
jgi:hypothetical protein